MQTATIDSLQEIDYSVKLFDRRGNELPEWPVSFTSSDPAIADVEADGQTCVVRGLAAGSVTITAHALGGADLPDTTLELTVLDGASPVRMEDVVGEPRDQA